jgi:hypothetical protein
MRTFISAVLLGAALLAPASPAIAGDTLFKSVSSGTNAMVAFGPDEASQHELTALLASSDTAAGAVKFYGLSDTTNRFAITTASTSGAFVVYFANAGQTVSTNDIVVYQYRNRRILGTTVASGALTGQVTLATALGEAGTTNDTLFKLTQMGQATIGTTPLNLAGFTIAVIPIGSPFAAVVTCATNGNITATRK